MTKVKYRPLFSREYKGQQHLMNPDWPYVNESCTDVGATFERVRLRMLNEQITRANNIVMMKR